MNPNDEVILNEEVAGEEMNTEAAPVEETEEVAADEVADASEEAAM